MKAILEFDMSDFDDRMDHLRMIKSDSLAIFIHSLVYNTKKDIENIIENNNEISKYDVLELVFKKINDLLEVNNINVDEIIR